MFFPSGRCSLSSVPRQSYLVIKHAKDSREELQLSQHQQSSEVSLSMTISPPMLPSRHAFAFG